MKKMQSGRGFALLVALAVLASLSPLSSAYAKLADSANNSVALDYDAQSSSYMDAGINPNIYALLCDEPIITYGNRSIGLVYHTAGLYTLVSQNLGGPFGDLMLAAENDSLNCSKTEIDLSSFAAQCPAAIAVAVSNDSSLSPDDFFIQAQVSNGWLAGNYTMYYTLLNESVAIFNVSAVSGNGVNIPRCDRIVYGIRAANATFLDAEISGLNVTLFFNRSIYVGPLDFVVNDLNATAVEVQCKQPGDLCDNATRFCCPGLGCQNNSRCGGLPPFPPSPPTPTPPPQLIRIDAFIDCALQPALIKVTDWNTGQNLVAADYEILFLDLSWRVVESGMTDHKGEIHFTPPAPGEYEIRVTRPGYQPAAGAFTARDCAPPECLNNSDCPGGLCVNGACVPCTTNDQCPSGLCVNGACITCTDNSQCESNLCINGVCVPCSSDAQCLNGTACVYGKCVKRECQPEGFACLSSEECCDEFRCIVGACGQCKAEGLACLFSEECCGESRCIQETCGTCRGNGGSCSGSSDCCSGACKNGACGSCTGDEGCEAGFCNPSGSCKCKPGDAACIKQLGPKAVEIPTGPPGPPTNITNVTPPISPCEYGAFCVNDSDCCGGKCLGSKCACRVLGCKATMDCCTGYCVAGECVSAPRAIALAGLSVLTQPSGGCTGLVGACDFAGCTELCAGMLALLGVVSLASAYIARKESNRLIPLIFGLTPLLIGLFTFPFVGILVAVVQIAFFAYYIKRK